MPRINSETCLIIPNNSVSHKNSITAHELSNHAPFRASPCIFIKQVQHSKNRANKVKEFIWSNMATFCPELFHLSFQAILLAKPTSLFRSLIGGALLHFNQISSYSGIFFTANRSFSSTQTHMMDL
jgi:hypothetical protein